MNHSCFVGLAALELIVLDALAVDGRFECIAGFAVMSFEHE
jgi:hypothetical protein